MHEYSDSYTIHYRYSPFHLVSLSAYLIFPTPSPLPVRWHCVDGMSAGALATVFGMLGMYGFLLCSMAEYLDLPAKMISFWLVVVAAFMGASSNGFNPNISRVLSGISSGEE